MWGHCTDYIEINLKPYQIRLTKPEFDENWTMPGGEVLRAVAASSLGHEDHIHWNQWNQKNQITSSYWTADARAGAETERADKQGQGGSLGARVKGLGLVQNRKFFVWESEASMRRWTCRPASLSLTSLTSCNGSGWSGTYQGNSKDSPLSWLQDN